MKSLWDDDEAAEFVAKYGDEHGEAVALRVYTSRLIGRDSDLVLHGGGNTSVKVQTRDILGDPIDVLCVKGSGWDLEDIEPAGLPAVRIQGLLRLSALEAMSDEEMVNQLRIHLLDAGAPNPSVEALLHAFVPRRFVDHTHADAILTLTNQPDGEATVRAALGDAVVILPWIMPGFPLAKAVAAAYAAKPDCQGVVLLKHGIFTFGDDARSSYEDMIELVDRAERYIASCGEGKTSMLTTGASCDLNAAKVQAARLVPVIRGALAAHSDGNEGAVCRMISEWRADSELLAFSLHEDAEALLRLGPLTPDHVIRTKGGYLLLTPEQASDGEACRAAIAAYAQDYQRYFEANRGQMSQPLVMLDPLPRVVVVRGVGVFAFGADKKAANVAADIAEHTLRSKARAQWVDQYTELPAPELFEMEYWSLEQAKLGKGKPATLAGKVALVTGAGGAIGHGVAEALLAAGAHVMLTDLSKDALDRASALLAERFAPRSFGVCELDVTEVAQVEAAFGECCLRFGGVDVVVPNAGIAHVSSLRDMDPERFRRVLDVNLTGTMTVLREAARVFERQGIGGSVVLQASKNVFEPGANFGAYSASKAGAHQLGKIAALELAPLGVRVNMINADAVFGDAVASGLWAEVGPDRMKARNLDPEGLRDFYRDRSLLKQRVTPQHVGAAVVFFASEVTPTTGATLPVDAGVPGAFPR